MASNNTHPNGLSNPIALEASTALKDMGLRTSDRRAEAESWSGIASLANHHSTSAGAWQSSPGEPSPAGKWPLGHFQEAASQQDLVAQACMASNSGGRSRRIVEFKVCLAYRINSKEL